MSDPINLSLTVPLTIPSRWSQIPVASMRITLPKCFAIPWLFNGQASTVRMVGRRDRCGCFEWQTIGLVPHSCRCADGVAA